MGLPAFQIPFYGTAADIHEISDLVILQVSVKSQENSLSFRKRKSQDLVDNILSGIDLYYNILRIIT